jgi:hypothetical protein
VAEQAEGKDEEEAEQADGVEEMAIEQAEVKEQNADDDLSLAVTNTLNKESNNAYDCERIR